MFSFELLLDAIVLGLLVGCFYAAVSIGLSVSFGLLDVPHVAHPAFLVLASYGTWLLNEPDLKGAAARQHERIAVTNRNAELTLTGGITLPCLLLDVSLSGASVACRAKPDIDEEVRLGRLKARVVRHHSEGVGLQFSEILDPDTLRAYFV